MVWYDPEKPIESAEELLNEARKYLGRNRPVVADRLISEALKTMRSMRELSTTPKSAKSTAARSAGNFDKEIDRLMDRLFSNGAGNEAERLVLTSKNGINLGGWCKDAVRNEIDTTVRRILRQGE